jgi:hypothetical protein
MIRNKRTAFSGHITLRSPAGGFAEGGQRPPSVLHFKGFKGDGFLKHRA